MLGQFESLNARNSKTFCPAYTFNLEEQFEEVVRTATELQFWFLVIRFKFRFRLTNAI
ncbi:hypothetical protein Nos7107_4361 [Nostoc sp. PCC 7107]|nr:hypothetical protein Nos7107_4361 [Nostoc sp. PCC 7107]